MIQRNAASPAAEITPELQSRVELFNDGGRPLPESDRAYFEPRFGHDFRDVTVHTGSKAAESARTVNAKAFTVGTDIIFGKGEYAPETNTGRQLLAHELTHVVQQGNTAWPGPGSLIQRQAEPASLPVPAPTLPSAAAEENSRRQQVACVRRLGGCPNARPGGIPYPDEIEQYNELCRSEFPYTGPNVTPTSEECMNPPQSAKKELNSKITDCDREGGTNEEDAIKKAHSNAIKLIDKALDAILNPDAKVFGKLESIFGIKSTDKGKIEQVLHTYQKAKDGLSASVTYECDYENDLNFQCGDGDFAGVVKVFGFHPGNIHICPGFLPATEFTQAISIMHEATHKFGDTEDITQDPLKDPINYEVFVGAIGKP